MTLCEWQKSTVFPYRWLFSGEVTRSDAYLKQMLLDCVTVKDGKVPAVKLWASTDGYLDNLLVVLQKTLRALL